MAKVDDRGRQHSADEPGASAYQIDNGKLGATRENEERKRLHFDKREPCLASESGVCEREWDIAGPKRGGGDKSATKVASVPASLDGGPLLDRAHSRCCLICSRCSW